MSINILKQRAHLLKSIREFFYARNFLEVETPLLDVTTNPDPFVPPIQVPQYGYLQTSPEFHMKRLLANNSGSIFQICKAFRHEERGSFHQPEFTMLEWYHVGFNHWQLMDEVSDLLKQVLSVKTVEKLSYQACFEQHLKINPHTCSTQDLIQLAKQKNIHITGLDQNDKDAWLNLLLAECIEPNLGKTSPVCLYDYPASQAALAKIRHDEYPLAERFEVYYRGLELANGFNELTDANEQRQRFTNDNAKRIKLGLEPLPIDELFLDALNAGLPDCAGIALGIDRLLMLLLDLNHIKDLIYTA